MKSQSYISILVATVILSTVGCKKLDFSIAGQKISFTSSYSSDLTRTAYSDEPFGTTYRVEWLVGDQMSIGSSQVEGVNMLNYIIAESSHDGYLSYGKLTQKTGEGLRWGDEDEYTFYAAYPAALDNFGPSGWVRWRLPETQLQGKGSGWNADNTVFTAVANGDYMFMAAKCEVDKRVSKVVDLPFKFIPTVLSLELSGVSDMTIKKIQLESSTLKLTGLLECTLYDPDKEGYPRWFFINSQVYDEKPFKTASICPTDDGQPVTLAKGKKLKADLFMAPCNITNLTLHVTLQTSSGDKSLSCEIKQFNETTSKYEFLTFAAHKRNILKGVVVPAGESVVIGEDAIIITWTTTGEDLNPNK